MDCKFVQKAYYFLIFVFNIYVVSKYIVFLLVQSSHQTLNIFSLFFFFFIIKFYQITYVKNNLRILYTA